MYPVLAQDEIQILDMNRRQRLAAAERDRLIRAHATSTGAPNRWGRLLTRGWAGLNGAVTGLFRGAGARPVEIGGEGAAARS